MFVQKLGNKAMSIKQQACRSIASLSISCIVTRPTLYRNFLYRNESCMDLPAQLVRQEYQEVSRQYAVTSISCWVYNHLHTLVEKRTVYCLPSWMTTLYGMKAGGVKTSWYIPGTTLWLSARDFRQQIPPVSANLQPKDRLDTNASLQCCQYNDDAIGLAGSKHCPFRWFIGSPRGYCFSLKLAISPLHAL